MAEKEREKPNMVQQDAIFIETVRKQQRLQILHTEYSFNPRKKLHVLPDKPMSRKPPEVIADTTEYIEAYRKACEVPRKKYPTPQTESQQIGWWSTPLIQTNRNDPRLHFQRVNTDVTQHKEFLLRSAAKIRDDSNKSQRPEASLPDGQH